VLSAEGDQLRPRPIREAGDPVVAGMDAQQGAVLADGAFVSPGVCGWCADSRSTAR